MKRSGNAFEIGSVAISPRVKEISARPLSQIGFRREGVRSSVGGMVRLGATFLDWITHLCLQQSMCLFADPFEFWLLRKIYGQAEKSSPFEEVFSSAQTGNHLNNPNDLTLI